MTKRVVYPMLMALLCVPPPPPIRPAASRDRRDGLPGSLGLAGHLQRLGPPPWRSALLIDLGTAASSTASATSASARWSGSSSRTTTASNAREPRGSRDRREARRARGERRALRAAGPLPTDWTCGWATRSRSMGRATSAAGPAHLPRRDLRSPARPSAGTTSPISCLATPGNSPAGMTYLLDLAGRRLAFSGDVMLDGARMHTWFDTGVGLRLRRRNPRDCTDRWRRSPRRGQNGCSRPTDRSCATRRPSSRGTPTSSVAWRISTSAATGRSPPPTPTRTRSPLRRRSRTSRRSRPTCSSSSARTSGRTST